MNTSKSLDDALHYLHHEDCDWIISKGKLNCDCNVAPAKQAIVEAVEGLKRDVINKIKVQDGKGLHVVGVELLDFEFDKAIKEWQ